MVLDPGGVGLPHRIVIKVLQQSTGPRSTARYIHVPAHCILYVQYRLCTSGLRVNVNSVELSRGIQGMSSGLPSLGPD